MNIVHVTENKLKQSLIDSDLNVTSRAISNFKIHDTPLPAN